MATVEREMTTAQATPRRRFSLVDGMILIGSLAPGLAILRAANIRPPDGWLKLLMSGVGENLCEALLVCGTPLLVSLTLGVLALRLRAPRPRWRRLRRQPGFVACLALILTWASVLGLTAYSILVNSAPPPPPNVVDSRFSLANWLDSFALGASTLGGFAVLVAWSTQALVGGWRPERSWLDRLGRVVGATWIVVCPVGWYVYGGI